VNILTISTELKFQAVDVYRHLLQERKFKRRSVAVYGIAGKFGKFGESSMIRQTKTIQISTCNYNLWLNLFIRQTFSPNAQNK